MTLASMQLISTKFLQIRIINACCILHNFVIDRQRDMDDLLIHQVDQVISFEPHEVQSEVGMITNVQSSNEWSNFRDTKANQMFADYQARRGQCMINSIINACLNL